MKRKNNEKGIIFFAFVFIFGVFLLNFVSAENCNLEISLINQDPYPAVPGDYVEVVFQVDGTQNSACEGELFELILSYPFSLEENNTLTILKSSAWISNYETKWMIPYKLRIDADAFDGNSTLIVKYGHGTVFTLEEFEIIIQDSRTNFDAVIQESSGSDVSIAIANVGKYTANSVVVRIPEQESFSVSGTDGQMVGNLASGDYTIVGFSVSSKMGATQLNIDRNRNEIPLNTTQQDLNKLKFDIYYTDNLGERRVVNMELPLNIGNSSKISTGNFNPRGTTSTNYLFKWYKWILLLLIFFIAYFVHKKYPKQIKEIINKIVLKLKNLIKKENKSNISGKIPNWIKNAKEKEKNK